MCGGGAHGYFLPLDFEAPIDTHLHARAFFGALGMQIAWFIPLIRRRRDRDQDHMKMKKAHHPGLAAVLEGKVSFSDMADPETWSKSGKQLSANECRASYVLADEPAAVCAGGHPQEVLPERRVVRSALEPRVPPWLVVSPPMEREPGPEPEKERGWQTRSRGRVGFSPSQIPLADGRRRDGALGTPFSLSSSSCPAVCLCCKLCAVLSSTSS